MSLVIPQKFHASIVVTPHCTWQHGGEPQDSHRIAGPARKRTGRDIRYIYFDNDVEVRAPRECKDLTQLLQILNQK